MDGMSNRERIRFLDIFRDYTTMRQDHKQYVMIKKREFNPELSVFSNLVLDLADFKDRVRPMAKDISLMDVAQKYQKYNAHDIEAQR